MQEIHEMLQIYLYKYVRDAMSEMEQTENFYIMDISIYIYTHTFTYRMSVF